MIIVMEIWVVSDKGQGYLTNDIQMDTTSKEIIDCNEVIGIADGEKGRYWGI